MDPVSRPEWAAPLEVGVHAGSFLSAMPEVPTREVLQALSEDVRLLAFLKRHPLGTLEFSGRLPNPDWLGSFDPQTRDLVVNSFRSRGTYGKEFYPPELRSLSEAGESLIEALQRTLYHELGHSILDVAGPDIEHQIAMLLRTAGRYRYRFEQWETQSSTSARHLPRTVSRIALQTKIRKATIWLRLY